MKNFLKQPINFIILTTCLVVIAYFSIKIYKEIGSKSLDERKIECLKLGSDLARKKCLSIVDGNESSGDKRPNLIDKFYPNR